MVGKGRWIKAKMREGIDSPYLTVDGPSRVHRALPVEGDEAVTARSLLEAAHENEPRLAA